MADKKKTIDGVGLTEDEVLQYCKDSLSIAQKNEVRKDHEAEWKRYVKLYRYGTTTKKFNGYVAEGNYYEKQHANYAANSVRTVIADVFSPDKKPRVDVVTEEIDNVGVIQAVIWDTWKNQNVHDKLKRAFFNMEIAYGVLKVSWNMGRESEKESPGLVNKALGKIKKVVTGKDSKLTNGDEAKMIREDDVIIATPDPTKIYVSASHTGTIDTAPQVIEELILTVGEFALQWPDMVDDVKPTEIVDGADEKDIEKISDNFKRIKIYEFTGWMENDSGKRDYVRAFFDDDNLFEIESTDYNPYIDMRMSPDWECFYPVPDIGPLEGLQNELWSLRNQMSKHRKKMTNVKIFAETNALEKQGKRAIRCPEVGQGVAVKPNKIDKIRYITPSPLGRDVYNQDGIIKEDMARAMRISQFNTGGQTTKQVRLATGLAMMSAATDKGMAERGEILNQAALRVGQKILDLYQRIGNEKRKVSVFDEKGRKEYVFTGEQLKGDYELRIDVTAHSGYNADVRNAQMLNAYELFKEDPDMSPEGRRQFKRKVLQQAFKFSDADRYFPLKGLELIEEENRRLAQDEFFVPNEDDDDIEHMRLHKEVAAKESIDNKSIIRHMKLHQQQLQSKQRTATPPAGAPGQPGMPGGMSGPPPTSQTGLLSSIMSQGI